MTETSLNFNNASFTDSGQLRFSGITSGINFQASVDAIIEGKRFSARAIEDKIAINDARISAYNELNTLASDFSSILNPLRGNQAPGAQNVFKQKLTFTDSRLNALAAPGDVASEAGEILGVTVTNAAATGRNVVEVVQTAEAHSIRSGAIGGRNTDLVNDEGVNAGTFFINGESVTVSAGDTLLDLRDRINLLNTGASATGVSASIISVSPTENYLVLNADETGAANEIVFGGGGSPTSNSLGFTSGGAIANELTAAQDAIIRVNNLGVDITRSTNTISDVIDGVTLNLFKAEENTEIVIDIENDLNAIKDNIIGFVDAYNAMADFITDQREEKVRVEGGDAEFGAIAFESTLRSIQQKLTELINANVPGADDGYGNLAEVGIRVNGEFRLEIDDDVFDERLLNGVDEVRKLFAFDFRSSDPNVFYAGSTLSTTPNTDGAGNVLPYYLNIGGTDGSGGVIEANIGTATGAGTSGDGSVTLAGNRITATDATGANGLELFYAAGSSTGARTDIEIEFTAGIADRLFTYFNQITSSGGILSTTTRQIDDQTSDYQLEVTEIDERLELERQKLTERFAATEAALAELNSLRDTIAQFSEAQSQGS